MSRWHIAALGGVLAATACEGTEGPLLVYDGVEIGGAGMATGGGAAGDASTGGTTDLPNPAQVRLSEIDSFQIQLSGDVDLEVDADLFVIDLHGPDAAVLEQLAARDASIGCYFSAGSFEPWRPDADDFPDSVLGEPLNDYPNEDWLDVTDAAVVELMRGRIALAAERGCSDVYPSLVRPGSTENDFGITDEEFADYATTLANVAREFELGALFAGGAGWDDNAAAYDGVLVFGCGAADTCGDWTDYSSSGRGVFQVEVGDQDTPADACTTGFPWPQIVKNSNLDAFRYPCP